MSNFVIAGEAGNPDLADCEFLGKKLEASTPSTHVHVIAKHSSEWDRFLKKLCNSYGFREASNPIIFTVDGKLIGDKYAFKDHVIRMYSVRGELDKNMKALISEFDKTSLDHHRQKSSEGPSTKDRIKSKSKQIIESGGMTILDGFFTATYDRGFEFWVKLSNMLSPFTYDDFEQWGESLDFVEIPELMPPKPETEIFSPKGSKATEEFPDQEEERVDEDKGSDVVEKEKSPSVESPIPTSPDENPGNLVNFEVDDRNLKGFLEFFEKADADVEVLGEREEVLVPSCVKTVLIMEMNVVKDLPKDYLLVMSPYPLIPGEMVVFSGKMVEGGWLLRDSSMMQNWIKLITIPPQRPVFREDDPVDPPIPKEPVFIKDMHSNCMNQRGFSCRTVEYPVTCARDPSLKLNSMNVYLRHILTECDWEIWHRVVKDLDAIGYYQFLPYGQMNFQPIRSGQMLVSMLPINGVSLTSFEELVSKYGDEQEFFTIPDFKFDHILCNFPKNINSRVMSEFFLMGIEKLRLKKGLAALCVDCGVNLVLMSGFMMIVPVYRPFAVVDGRNLYPDPLWSVGVMSLPVLPKSWPETAGETSNKTPFELLEYCSNL